MSLENLDDTLVDGWLDGMGCYHPVVREDNMVGNTQEDDRASDEPPPVTMMQSSIHAMGVLHTMSLFTTDNTQKNG